VPMNQSLELELKRGLREVAAPPELWDRMQAARFKPQQNSRRFVWSLALAVVLAALSLARVRPPAHNDEPQSAFHCQNPAQLRAWVRANSGLDVPLRSAPPASIRLIGARNLGARVEIAYRAGDRDAVLLVARADSGSANQPHSRLSGNGSSWVMDGQRYTLAAGDSADLQLACKLCHLD